MSPMSPRVALVLGSVVERMKFSAVMVFAAIWLTIVYFPVAHMVWYDGGDNGVSGNSLTPSVTNSFRKVRPYGRGPVF